MSSDVSTRESEGIRQAWWFCFRNVEKIVDYAFDIGGIVDYSSDTEKMKQTKLFKENFGLREAFLKTKYF